jgi:hypothetical protein
MKSNKCTELRRFSWVWVWLWVGFQSGERSSGLECFEELVVPQYSEFARNAGLQGTVIARFSWEPSSKAPRVSIEGRARPLEGLVGAALNYLGRSRLAPVRLWFASNHLGEGAGTIARPHVSIVPPATIKIRVAPTRLDRSDRMEK